MLAILVAKEDVQSEGPAFPQHVEMLIASLEESQLLEVLSAALLAAPLPPPPPLSSVDLLEKMTAEVARNTGQLANTMSMLAARGLSQASMPKGTDQPGAEAQVQGQRQLPWRAEVLARLWQLLLRPSVQQLQWAMLGRFCRNGGEALPSDDVVGGSVSGGGGWSLMDALRLDRRLCQHIYAKDQRGVAYLHAANLATLALPALMTWAGAQHLPRLRSSLPPGRDGAAARAAAAAASLAEGRGETGLYDHPIPHMDSVLAAIADSVKVDRSAGSPQQHAASTPSALEAHAWFLVFHTRLAADKEAQMLTAAAAGGGAVTGGEGPPIARSGSFETGHWLGDLGLALHAMGLELNEGWGPMDPAAQADAAQRIARTDLMLSLDHALRLMTTYTDPGCPVLLYDSALGCTELVVNILGALLLRRLCMLAARTDNAAAAGVPGAPGASSSRRLSPSEQLRRELGLYVTVAKLAGQLAQRLFEATSVAAAAGFTLPSSSTAAEDLVVLRLSLYDTFHVLNTLCTSAGPLAVAPGMRPAAEHPDVQTVAALCLRACVRGAAALLGSVEWEQRVAWRPQGRCMLRSADPDLALVAQAAQDVVRLAPQCLLGVLASGAPAAEVLALGPQELLRHCGSLLCDMLGAGEELHMASETTRRRDAAVPLLARLQLPDAMAQIGAQCTAFSVATAVLGSVAHAESAAAGAAERREGDDQSRGLFEQLGLVGPQPSAAEADARPAGPLGRVLQDLIQAIGRAGGSVVPAFLDSVESLLEAALHGPTDDVCERARQAALRGLVRIYNDLSMWRVASECVSMLPDVFGEMGIGRQVLLALQAAGQDPAALGGEGSELRQGLIGEVEPPQQPAWPTRPPRMCGCPSCANFHGPCEEGLALKQCARCRFVRYCCPECQRQHWPQHRRLCPLLKASVVPRGEG